MIHLGRIVGIYQYDPTLDAHYPHQRKVEWLKAVPRTHFSPSAIYEMGYASLSQIRVYASEFFSALIGALRDVPSSEPEVKQQVFEETTEDFISNDSPKNCVVIPWRT